MIKRKYKPDKTFTMKNDGFFGELYISTDNIFNGKCIIAFGGSEGNFLLTQLCADKFKDAGISVMIIAYHGKNGLPKILKNQPVDVIENSAKYLLNNGYKQIGVWGISMGGCLALLAGSLMPELISCIVSIAPLQMVMQAEKAKTPVEGSSFSFHGTELPFVRYVPQGKAWKQEMKKAMWKHKEPYTKDLLRLAYKENKNRSAEIKVENIKAPILLLGGAMDSMCPNEETFNDITQRLKSSDFSYHVESIIYPHLSHYVLPIKPLSAKMFLAERKYPNECNKERVESWEDTLSFLKLFLTRA